MRKLLVAAALAAAAVPAAPAAAGPCVRTPGSVYWEVCTRHDGCLVYVWTSMPPAICVTR